MAGRLGLGRRYLFRRFNRQFLEPVREADLEEVQGFRQKCLVTG